MSMNVLMMYKEAKPTISFLKKIICVVQESNIRIKETTQNIYNLYDFATLPFADSCDIFPFYFK